MAKYHGIIFAYKDAPELGDLTRERTVASLPFCGRYRLIDFALSSMRNAGITDVGVIMARDYQSLLDHIGSGKDWDMSRRSGGLRMLPPFGLPHAHTGNYAGTVEALNAVAAYIRDIPQQHIVLMVGSVIANIDLTDAIAAYEAGGADITADMDGDEMITSYDAYLLLNWEPEAPAEGYTVAPHGKAEVTVYIRLTAAQKAVLNEAERRGGYLEGYTYVTCTTAEGGLE